MKKTKKQLKFDYLDNECLKMREKIRKDVEELNYLVKIGADIMNIHWLDIINRIQQNTVFLQGRMIGVMESFQEEFNPKYNKKYKLKSRQLNLKDSK